jgi:transposase-like protein
MNRVKYSDDDKASALTLLAVNNGNVKRTARVLGIPRSTLKAWAHERGIHAGVAKLCHLKKESLADRLEEAARVLLDGAITPAKIEAASLRDTVFALAICVDKMLLLRGCPTKIDRNPDGTLKGFRH